MSPMGKQIRRGDLYTQSEKPRAIPHTVAQPKYPNISLTKHTFPMSQPAQKDATGYERSTTFYYPACDLIITVSQLSVAS